MNFELLKALAKTPDNSGIWRIIRKQYEVIHIDITIDYLLALGGPLAGPFELPTRGGFQ